MITLTWWELEELLDHLADRPDIWTFDEDSTTWVRTDTEGNLGCAFRLRGPSNSGPYRQYQLQPLSFGWTDEETEKYLIGLCMNWTGYGVRMEQMQLLIEDDGIKMNPQIAAAVSVALALIEQRPRNGEDTEPAPPDLTSGFPDHILSIAPSKVYHLVQGGYVAFRERSSILRVDISLPLPDGGYIGEGQLYGYVRTKNGNFDGTLDLLFNPEKYAPEKPEVTLDETLLLRVAQQDPPSSETPDPSIPDVSDAPGDEVRDVSSNAPGPETGDLRQGPQEDE